MILHALSECISMWKHVWCMWTSRSIAVADSDGCWSLDVHFIADASHPLSCWPWQQPFAFPRNTCVWTSDGCTVMLQILKASAMRGFYMPCGSKLTGDLHVAWTHMYYSCVACLGCILYCSTLFVSMHSSVVHSKPHVWAEIVRFLTLGSYLSTASTVTWSYAESLFDSNWCGAYLPFCSFWFSINVWRLFSASLMFFD